ncbi:RNA-binding domain-containing protein [Rozella allomycis CSF55]|uniref:Nucleotide-binding, alpha-beta plait domain-containing protein n=1 Tax=Rozella allomycis (strain CSF55) TaxID=988480 RepID=A0A075AWB7_ROZAC|nr:Nucleotide-binding, alpha-beta plait domain-containing protein [Rozella allomycis CSF55]RKP20240.1 RNA-binding domain-containing protein [Rozella allomycis CSF55]|eukprot:EPZ34545.1 Nucleotide-binding, alpha-beta plait domain-containing protein [Rozella allomycis CSF55]
MSGSRIPRRRGRAGNGPYDRRSRSPVNNNTYRPVTFQGPGPGFYPPFQQPPSLYAPPPVPFHAPPPPEPQKEPVTREEPFRTLFVRNIEYGCPEQEIRELFEPFGDIKSIYNLIEKRGMAFVTYYDIRCAERAKREMNGYRMKSDRCIDVHFSTPKDDDLNTDRCDETKNQLSELFGQYGSVKSVRIYKDTPNRHCVDAFNSIEGKEINGGTFELRYTWDLSIRVMKHEIADGRREVSRKRDSRDGGDKRRSSGRRTTSDSYRPNYDERDSNPPYMPPPLNPGFTPQYPNYPMPQGYFPPGEGFYPNEPYPPMQSNDARLAQAQQAQQVISTCSNN